MPIPRTWSEEFVCEWLCLKEYLTEVGIGVGTGSKGGRKEADVVGVRIIENEGSRRVLEIYHVEIGQLGSESENVERLSEKFSKTRTDNIVERFKKRMAFVGDVKYHKLYIDIWERQRATKLMDNAKIAAQKIKVWPISKLYREALTTIREQYGPTLPESHWMLKLLYSLDDSNLLK